MFKECPYEGGYDLKIGDSPKGKYPEFVDFSQYKGFEHGLIFFGGLEGIEGLVDLEENSGLKASEVSTLFDEYLNTCPESGTRSTRTEE